MSIMTNSPISFPGLFGDWEFTVPSKALDIGKGVYWYGILITLGLIIAVFVCLKQRKNYGLSEDDILDCVLFGIPAGIIGARLYYVIFYLDEFRNSDGSLNLGSVIAIWDGGLAIYGAIIAVVIVIICVSKHRHFKMFSMLDIVVIGLFIGQAVGRWGNFMNREAFGTETTLPWRMQLTTTLGTTVCVHPTFFYESLWNVIGLCLLLFIVSKARRFDGENTCFYFLWYGVGRFFIEGLRTDSLYLFNVTLFGQPVRVSQALSLIMVIVSLIALVYNLKIHPHSPDEMQVNIVKKREEAAADSNESETAENV